MVVMTCDRDKLREMMVMVDRENMDLDQLDTHTYYCKVFRLFYYCALVYQYYNSTALFCMLGLE